MVNDSKLDDIYIKMLEVMDKIIEVANIKILNVFENKGWNNATRCNIPILWKMIV